MGRYLATGRGRFPKTHLLTGYGEKYVTNCGLVFIRKSKAYRELERKPLRPVDRTQRGNVWDLSGVTCEHCLEFGLKPFRQKRGKKGVDLHGERHGGGEHGSRRVYPTEGG